jgi:hypothetical protein
MSMPVGGACSAHLPPSLAAAEEACTHTHTHKQPARGYKPVPEWVQYTGRLGGMIALFRKAIDPDYRTTPTATTVSCP